MSELSIRDLGAHDEHSARDAHAELAREGFEFLLDLREGEPWLEYVRRVANWPQGVGLPDGWVPSTFLVAVTSESVVGRISIRHRLTPYLAEIGGHVGYAVRPAHRRRGYATALLGDALAVARRQGLEQVLVTCDEDNIASSAVIENCGGRYERLSQPIDGGRRKRRYWMDL